MIPNDFRKWIKEIPGLTKRQRLQCMTRFQQRHDVPPAIALAVPEFCPHCQYDKLWKWGHASGLQRWRCQQCSKTFNVLTGTPLARLRKKDKWMDNAEAMIAGFSVRRAARKCGVHRNTSFRWRHRFLRRQQRAQFGNLSGISECDTTYFNRSEKGSRYLNRKPRRRGGDGIKSGSWKYKVGVITVRDRSGRGADRVSLGSCQRGPARDLFLRHLRADTLLLTDGSHELCQAADARDPNAHLALPGLKSRGIKGCPYHIQTANGFHAQLKIWMARFHGVATKYLANYVGWHRHLVERNHNDNPDSFIQLSFNPLSINPQLTVT